MTRRVTYAQANKPTNIGVVFLSDGCAFYLDEGLITDWIATRENDDLLLEVQFDEEGKKTKQLKPIKLIPHGE